MAEQLFVSVGRQIMLHFHVIEVCRPLQATLIFPEEKSPFVSVSWEMWFNVIIHSTALIKGEIEAHGIRSNGQLHVLWSFFQYCDVAFQYYFWLSFWDDTYWESSAFWRYASIRCHFDTIKVIIECMICRSFYVLTRNLAQCDLFTMWDFKKCNSVDICIIHA